MQNLQEQFSAHQVRIGQVSQRIQRLESQVQGAVNLPPMPDFTKEVSPGETIKWLNDQLQRISNNLGGSGPAKSDPTYPAFKNHCQELVTEREALQGAIEKAEAEQAALSELSAKHSRTSNLQGALESAKKEYLNLTGSRYGE